MKQLHAHTSKKKKINQLLLINEIGADVFKEEENTKVHMQIELS